MGRHSQSLYIGRRGFLVKKLNKELCKNLRDNNLQDKVENKQEVKQDSVGIADKVVYTPCNPPKDVIFMYGILEINPAIFENYVNELYEQNLNSSNE